MKENSKSIKSLAQSVKMPKILKFLQYALKFAVFTLLLVVCYIYFMKEAIEQFKKKATTVTERSIPIEDLGGYKSPAIVVCPNPAFKPSISDLHGFTYPTRDLFNMRTTQFSEKYKYIFNKTTIQSQFDAFSYADDLVFKAFGTAFHEGDNLLDFGDVKIDIDEAYLNEVSSEDLSAALVEAIRSGETKANEVVAEKYKTLEAEMSGILGGLGGAPQQ